MDYSSSSNISHLKRKVVFKAQSSDDDEVDSSHLKICLYLLAHVSRCCVFNDYIYLQVKETKIHKYGTSESMKEGK
jgi:hypothetical protein